MSDVLNNKQHLLNIDLLRIILIVLMVFYHSFCFYIGAWGMPLGVKPVHVYSVLSELSYSFFLETFVFLSGLLYGVSSANRTGNVKFSKILMKKFKRLMIPSIVFSFLYFLCFKEYTSITTTLYTILLGCGHLWFLPMLFGCFILIVGVEKYYVKDKTILLLYPLLIVFSIPDIPLHVSKICYYFCFFYLGYRMIVYKIVYSCNSKLLLCIFVVSFIVEYQLFTSRNSPCTYNKLIDFFNENQIVYVEVFLHLFKIFLRICYSICGLLLSMKICVTIAKKDKMLSIEKNVSKVASCGMGVYIVQQFILIGLYYHTEYCQLINDYLIPWLAFLFTTCVSLIVVLIAKKSKIGRYLLG